MHPLTQRIKKFTFMIKDKKVKAVVYNKKRLIIKASVLYINHIVPNHIILIIKILQSFLPQFPYFNSGYIILYQIYNYHWVRCESGVDPASFRHDSCN